MMKRPIEILLVAGMLLGLWVVARSAHARPQYFDGQWEPKPAMLVYAWRPIASYPANVAVQQEPHDIGGGLHEDNDDDDDDITPHLTVRGEAELDKPADELQLSLGVLTEGDDAEQTLERNSELMEDVIKAVQKAGLTEDEFETGRFRVQPVYSRRPRQPDEGWTPRITGYQVNNTLDITTGKLDLAGTLIQQANKAGANTVHSIGFGLSDARTHRAEAIETATKHAIADAKVVAQAAGVNLKRVISISVDDATSVTPPPPSRNMRMRAMAEGGGGRSTPVSPGKVTVKASVTIVYEIGAGE